MRDEGRVKGTDMASVKRFEDLIAWQKARVLTKDIYRVTRKGTFAKDYGLTGQMQRCCLDYVQPCRGL